MRNIKEFLKRTNPYMVGSIVIVVFTICLIVWLICDGTKGEDIPLQDTIVKVETNETEQKEEKEVIFVRETESQVMETVASTESIAETTEETKEVMVLLSKEEGAVPKSEPPRQAVSELVGPEPESTNPSGSEPEQEEPEPPAEVKPEPEEPEIPEPTPTPEPPKECNHNFIFDSYYQEPTCSSGGLENQVCMHCGMSQTTPGTPTGEHHFVTETEGDCCSEEVVICKDCNYRETWSKNSGNHIDVEDGFCYGCGTKLH